MEKREDIVLPIEGQQLSFLDTPLSTMNQFIKNSSPRELFPDFKKGYSAFGMNNGSFSFGDVIEYILQNIGPAHALISSWVASQAASEKVVEWLGNHRLKSARFLLDRMFTETRRTVYNYIVKKFGVDSIRTSRVHTKFCVLYNAEWFEVIAPKENGLLRSAQKLQEIPDIHDYTPEKINFDSEPVNLDQLSELAKNQLNELELEF